MIIIKRRKQKKSNASTCKQKKRQKRPTKKNKWKKVNSQTVPAYWPSRALDRSDAGGRGGQISGRVDISLVGLKVMGAWAELDGVLGWGGVWGDRGRTRKCTEVPFLIGIGEGTGESLAENGVCYLFFLFCCCEWILSSRFTLSLPLCLSLLSPGSAQRSLFLARRRKGCSWGLIKGRLSFECICMLLTQSFALRLLRKWLFLRGKSTKGDSAGLMNRGILLFSFVLFFMVYLYSSLFGLMLRSLFPPPEVQIGALFSW